MIQMNIKIDKDLKDTVDNICKQLGITSTDAIRIFFNKVKFVNGLPFNLRLTDNKDSEYKQEVIDGILEDEKHIDEFPRYNSTKELFDSVGITNCRE